MRNRWLFAVAVLVVFFTTAFGIGFSRSASGGALSRLSEAELALIYSKNIEQMEKLQMAKQKLETELRQIKSGQEEKLTVLQKRRALLSELKALACDARLNGPGIVIKISTEERTFLGWDWAINLVNTAFSAGAKGASVNGRRLGPRWHMAYRDGLLYVEGEAKSGPFEFAFVGNAEAILSALKLPSGVFDNLRARGVKIEYETKRDVLLQACGE
ncbi:DUF881 domain-containing protein [Coprothermobacteraceae bacterium]|nr:DUF881 domain-containing protein [Coprothermobacteraceae bacterium]